MHYDAGAATYNNKGTGYIRCHAWPCPVIPVTSWEESIPGPMAIVNMEVVMGNSENHRQLGGLSIAKVWLPEAKILAVSGYSWRTTLVSDEWIFRLFKQRTLVYLWSGDSRILDLGYGFGLHETGSIFNYVASLRGLHKLFCSVF